MKVALLSRGAHPLHPPGGMERAVYLLAKHLQGEGLDVTLFTRPGKNAEAFPGRVVTTPYGRWPLGRHGSVVDRTFNYPHFSNTVGDVVAKAVGRGEIDIVDAQGLMALGYGKARARNASLLAPLVMNPQGMEEHRAQGLKGVALRRLRLLSRKAAQLSDVVIATDNATKDDVPRLLNVAPSKVRVVPNGIDLVEIERLKFKDNFVAAFDTIPWASERRTIFLSVGRIEAYKGFVDTAHALRRAAPAFADTWGWIIVGDGPLRLQLKKECAPFGDNVRFAGRVNDDTLHAIYSASDVFCHPTHFEGSSLVTLEAMAHGLPIVATRAGGIPDKVVSGENGVLVNPGDIEGLAKAFVDLTRDKVRRQAMGKKSLERVTEFAWPKVAKRVVALYEELLRKRK